MTAFRAQQAEQSEAIDSEICPVWMTLLLLAGTDRRFSSRHSFPPLPPLPPIQYWMAPPPPSSHSDSEPDEDFPDTSSKGAPGKVFLALGARRACVPYTPAFTGVDTRVVRPLSAREKLALRDAAGVCVRLGARVAEGEDGEGMGMGMWSLSYVSGS